MALVAMWSLPSSTVVKSAAAAASAVEPASTAGVSSFAEASVAASVGAAVAASEVAAEEAAESPQPASMERQSAQLSAIAKNFFMMKSSLQIDECTKRQRHFGPFEFHATDYSTFL